MKTLKTMVAALAASSAMFAATAPANALDELTVAYFLEWPTPNQFAQANKMYEKELGVKVNWVSFDAGTAMSAAMASGDVHISFSQGVTPFLVATAAGQDLQVVDIAVSYSDNDNCVVRSELEITKDNVADLKGKKVAVPLGTAAHSGFLAQMKHFGMACGWGGSLRTMKQHGNPIIEGAEKEAVVGKVFDVTSIPTSFGEENPELLAKFLKVTADMNVIGTFVFPTVEEQLSDAWMGGFVAKHLAASAASLEEGGKIKALSDYSALVNASYLEAASKM